MSFSALSIGREGFFFLNSMKKAARGKDSFFGVNLITAARSGEPPKRASLMKFARGGAKGEGVPPRAEGKLIL